jgi:alpha-beta hydrolase superfamily lysophospholipase
MVVTLGVVAVGVWLGIGGFLWMMQDKLIFPIPGGIGRDALDAAAAELGAEPMTLETADAVHLYAWHLRAAGSTGRRLVLYLHGNGETVADYTPLYRILMRSGWDVLATAYRGYPGSDPVPPSEEGLARDAQAAWDWAVGPGGYAPDHVVVHGRSLGGGVAAILVDGDANPAGLVLESTFASLTDLARRTAPTYPVSLLLRSRFDTRDRAPRLGVPVLVLHSRDDLVIPIDLSARALLPVIAEVEYHETAGWTHQDCLPVADPDLRAAYLAFLEQRVPAGP